MEVAMASSGRLCGICIGDGLETPATVAILEYLRAQGGRWTLRMCLCPAHEEDLFTFLRARGAPPTSLIEKVRARRREFRAEDSLYVVPLTDVDLDALGY
jgi:hypothetical protein